MIKQIEELGPELDIGSFSNAEELNGREISIHKTGTKDVILFQHGDLPRRKRAELNVIKSIGRRIGSSVKEIGAK